MWNDLTNAALEKEQLETIEKLLPLDTLLDWIQRYFNSAVALLQVSTAMLHGDCPYAMISSSVHLNLCLHRSKQNLLTMRQRVEFKT